jgi:hypothetical protein
MGDWLHKSENFCYNDFLGNSNRIIAVQKDQDLLGLATYELNKDNDVLWIEIKKIK